MRLRINQVVLAVLVGMLSGLSGCKDLGFSPLIPQRPGTYLAPSADIKADPKTVGEIVSAFTEAEEALTLSDLDRIMMMYSENYQHDGFTKDGLRKIWMDLLSNYRDFSTMHVFSQISVEGTRNPPIADVTCTGSLTAVYKQTGDRVTIDSWFMEVHHMVQENGRWRIRRHAEEAPQEHDIRPSRPPHPFF